MESSGLAVLTAMVIGLEYFRTAAITARSARPYVLGGFSNSALVTIIALMICSKALEVTGALHTTTRVLMPVGFATVIGGMATTIGTSGGYRFTDFVRLGFPLQLFMWPLLSWLLAMGVGL
jgi:di/tricarboxylate transporter